MDFASLDSRRGAKDSPLWKSYLKLPVVGRICFGLIDPARKQ